MSTPTSWGNKLLSGRRLLLLALLAAVLGGKFLLIDRASSDLPFWDQWDAEGDFLIRPWVEGRLQAAPLLAAHNEHRILFTRLLALGLFTADGSQWDARVEMAANALLHALFALLLARLAWELLPPLGAWLFAGAIALACTTPAAWENTLGGFQSQFYFLLLFSALHLAGTLVARPRSWAWWAAPFAGACALFSMASGVFSAATLVVFLALRAGRDRRLSPADRGMLAANVALVLAGGLLRVSVPGHHALQAASVGAWLSVTLHELSWPLGAPAAALLTVVPPLVLLWAWLRRTIDNRWAPLLLAGAGWSGLQVAALAFARAATESVGYSSRYTDLLATGWLINLLVLALLVREARSPAGRRAWILVLATFSVLGLAGLSRLGAQSQRDALEALPQINRARIEAVRGYLAHPDPAFFQKQPYTELPYPDAHRLAGLLDVAALRAALPPDVSPAARPLGPLSRLATAVVPQGSWLLGLAALLTAVGLVRLRTGTASTDTDGHRHPLAAAFPLLGAAALAWVLAVRLGALAEPLDPLAPAPDHNKIPGFALADPAQPALGPASFVGAAFLNSHRNADWLGTFVGGDGYVGEATSTPFRLTGDQLHVPIAGYPSSAGNSLTLVVLNDQGGTLASVVYDGPDPREAGGAWDLPVAAWKGHSARLILTDASTHSGGWLAVGVPSFDHGRGAIWLDGVPRNYGWYLITALALAALLFFPGLALLTWLPGRWPAGAARVALPGFFLLVLGGLIAWLGGVDLLDLPADCWLAGSVALGGALAARWWRQGAPLAQADVQALGIYGCVALSALAFGVLPLEVAQEFDPHTTGQARMIASPPDHIIPYRTATYFYHGKDGRQDRSLYFGADWSVGSRGPLAPLAITAGMVLLHEPPPDPPAYALDRWPAAHDGVDVARILGILTNALVILGGAALATQLGGGRTVVALVWLSVAPVTMMNVDFLWPKLLAIFFVLLAAREILGGRRIGRAAGWTALAYLSHPVGGLMAPPLMGLLAWCGRRPEGSRAGRPAWGAAIGFALALAVLISPWLLYKHWIGQPDVFLRYPLGDGYGFGFASTPYSWINCRIENLLYSLVPGALYFSNEMRGWLGGALSPPLRWAIDYAKSLPGELGLGMFVVAIFALVRRPASAVLAAYRTWLLAAAGLLMLVFWGYSADGLGRNCLEPIAVLVMVYSAGVKPSHWGGWRWLLLLTVLEALGVRAIGVAFAPAFSAAYLGPEAVALGAIAAGAALLPVLWFFLRSPDADPR